MLASNDSPYDDINDSPPLPEECYAKGMSGRPLAQILTEYVNLRRIHERRGNVWGDERSV